MGIRKISTAAIAIAFGSLIATSAFAHSQNNDYANCKQSKLNGGTVGGFLGAGAGAAAGKALAAASVRPEGVILGAVVGAVIGNKVGKNSVYCPEDDGKHYGDHYYDGHKNANKMHHHGPHNGQQQIQNGGVIYYNTPNQQPVYMNGQNNNMVGWYQPSPYGYYGQQYNPQVVYVQPYQGQVVVQEFVSGPTYVPAPQYAAPVQYAPQVQYAPPSCGTWVCQ